MGMTGVIMVVAAAICMVVIRVIMAGVIVACMVMPRMVMLVIMAAARTVIVVVITLHLFAGSLFLRQQSGLEAELAQRVLDFFDRGFACLLYTSPSPRDS